MASALSGTAMAGELGAYQAPRRTILGRSQLEGLADWGKLGCAKGGFAVGVGKGFRYTALCRQPAA